MDVAQLQLPGAQFGRHTSPQGGMLSLRLKELS
jgi:hypothetical protein